MRTFLVLLLLISSVLAAPLTSTRPEKLSHPVQVCPVPDRSVLLFVTGPLGRLALQVDRGCSGITLDDLTLFPSAVATSHMIAWGEEHERWLESKIENDPLDVKPFHVTTYFVGEAEWPTTHRWRHHVCHERLELWKWLQIAHGCQPKEGGIKANWSVEGRLRALQVLREELGWENYRAGRMPIPAHLPDFTER